MVCKPINLPLFRKLLGPNFTDAVQGTSHSICMGWEELSLPSKCRGGSYGLLSSAMLVEFMGHAIEPGAKENEKKMTRPMGHGATYLNRT